MTNNNKKYIQAGELLGTFCSETGFVPNPKYAEQIKPKSSKVNTDMVSQVPLRSPASSSKSTQTEREEAFERLSLLQVQRARMIKDLEKLDKVIDSIKESLGY